MHDTYLSAIKSFEGYTAQAKWDYAQHSVGYGTKAKYAGEVIDKVEADRRFREEIATAEKSVERFAPGLDSGTKASLTSLTYNAGTAWMNDGLGAAVKQGDLGQARNIFLKYCNAGGEHLPGLAARRAQEATWIAGAEASAVGGAMAAIGPAPISPVPTIAANMRAGALAASQVAPPVATSVEASSSTASDVVATVATDAAAVSDATLRAFAAEHGQALANRLLWSTPALQRGGDADENSSSVAARTTRIT